MRKSLLALAVLIGAAGCSGDAASTSTSTVSNPSAAPRAADQAFNLYTHCGADWRTSFDSSYWDLKSPVAGPLGNPYQPGAMKLLDPQTAEFDYAVDGRSYSIVFVRHPMGAPLKPPSCCD